MSYQSDNIILLLEPFGLNQDESKIYLNLLEKNVSSALKISRDLHLARTKVYRLLDKLIIKQLVIQQCSDSGFKFRAANPSRLNFLLSQKESEITSLKKSLPDTLSILKNHIGIDNPSSRVLFYQGQEGLSQVNWNILNTKDEFLSYEINSANAYLPTHEAEKLRQELINKNISSRTLMNQKNLKTFSQVKKIKLFQQIHFINPKILTIQSDIFIYNDIFTICHYLDNKDIFCLEIQNHSLVDMQKQIFENLWSQSKPIKITNQK